MKVQRTQASLVDTLGGILGEFSFAQWHGDWRVHRVGANKGDTDFAGVEVKTSAFPFQATLNLLVREDDAGKRKPPFYVQVILDVPSPRASRVEAGTRAIIAGWATAKEVDASPLRDFGSKLGGRGGYRCHHLPISVLHDMASFREADAAWQAGPDFNGP